jgi:hypothetical protein
MNLPGFTADAAIYKNTRAYRHSAAGALSPAGVMPQLRGGGGNGSGGTNCICIIPAFSHCHWRLICGISEGCVWEYVCGDRGGCFFWLCP